MFPGPQFCPLSDCLRSKGQGGYGLRPTHFVYFINPASLAATSIAGFIFSSFPGGVVITILLTRPPLQALRT